MILRFFGTRIGIALLVALAAIGGATYIKLRAPAPNPDLADKIDLVASASVKNALENGQLANSDWEKVLEAIQGSTTVDQAIASLSQNSSENASSDAPLTATDRFAQRFLTEYVALKESGRTVDENTTVNLVNKLLTEDYGTPGTIEKTYTAADIRISSDSSVSALKIYGNSLGSAFSQPRPADYMNEMAILDQVYQTQNGDSLKKLAQNIEYYGKIRAAVAAVAAPKPLQATHIALLNSLSAMIDGIRGMEDVTTDPVGSAKIILRYQDGLSSLDIATRQITAYFKREHVPFSTSESGYIFME